MARQSKTAKRNIENYAHTGEERLNNPPVGLVTLDNDPDAGNKTYVHDPHLDPTLVWAGKAERTSFEVPTASLHVHERIEPQTIIEAVRKRNCLSLLIPLKTRHSVKRWTITSTDTTGATA